MKDRGLLTIKDVAEDLGLSAFSVRDNVRVLLASMPVEERIPVLEHMLICKKSKGRRICMKELNLEQLPVIGSYKDVLEFLGATKAEVWESCLEFERRMKKARAEKLDVHIEFSLDLDLIKAAADEWMRATGAFLMERVDPKNPLGVIAEAAKAPKDKPDYVLRLLRRHGFGVVELTTWTAADRFLSHWIERKTRETVASLFSRLPR